MADIEDIIAVLQLIHTQGIGVKSFYRLVAEHGSAQRAVRALEKQSKFKPWPRYFAEEEVRKAQGLDIDIVLYKDDDYPGSLKEIDTPPPLLYLKGRREALHYQKALAIVGSRAASVNGRKFAARLARDLTEAGVCIVSGMARGIDTSAHKGAMYANDQTGTTIAVLGTGVDVVYPPQNKEVYEQITKQGCLISELPLGTQALSSQFPQRNRIVAGLSHGVLVVEAGLKSGSLITAQFGFSSGKPVFAVPGTPGESRTQGSNCLIKQGAVLVEKVDDILPFLKGNKSLPKKQIATAEQKILVFENNDDNYSEEEKEPTELRDFLTADGVDIDELVRLTGKAAPVVAAEILELELSGVAERRAGNKVALKR